MLNFVKTYFLKKLVLLSKVRRFLCARWIFLKKLENKFVTHKSNISYHSLFRVLSTGHGKKCKSIDFSPLISGCARKLSTIMIIFCPFLLNLRSRSRGHSSISFPSIHAFFWPRYWQGRYGTWLNHLGLANLTIANISIFSLRALDAAIPVILFLLCFQPEQDCPLKCKVLDGRASQNRPSLSTL